MRSRESNALHSKLTKKANLESESMFCLGFSTEVAHRIRYLIPSRAFPHLPGKLPVELERVLHRETVASEEERDEGRSLFGESIDNICSGLDDRSLEHDAEE